MVVAVVVVVVLEWRRLSEVEPVLAEQPPESEPADSESGSGSEVAKYYSLQARPGPAMTM